METNEWLIYKNENGVGTYPLNGRDPEEMYLELMAVYGDDEVLTEAFYVRLEDGKLTAVEVNLS